MTKDELIERFISVFKNYFTSPVQEVESFYQALAASPTLETQKLMIKNWDFPDHDRRKILEAWEEYIGVLGQTPGVVRGTKAVDAAHDPVNHPKHYTFGKIEVIDVIEDWKLGFCLGNTVKYIARSDHKGRRLEDLKKAAWYLAREIGRVEREEKT